MPNRKIETPAAMPLNSALSQKPYDNKDTTMRKRALCMVIVRI
jgi:hypothetical protein